MTIYKKSHFIKRFLYNWLENDNNPKKFIVDIVINSIIIISVILLVFEFSIDNIPEWLKQLNKFLLYFFVLEYIIRFYIGTNFREDIKKYGIKSAILNKIKWMTEFSHIIDFLAILPVIRFLRIFRTLRLLRFIRFLRLLRIFRVIDLERILIVLRGMKSGNRVFIILFLITILLVTTLSFGIYMAESKVSNNDFNTYSETFLFSLKLIGLAELTPKSFIGKIFSSLILLANILFVSFFIALIINKMETVMQKIKNGDLGKINLKGHIVLCGYTRSTEVVIEELLKEKEKNYNKIVLLTPKSGIDIKGVIYLKGDFSEPHNLNNANIKYAKMAIVFAEEFNQYEDKKTIDLRTVMTVFNIEKTNPEIHTIAEINYRENAEIIKDRIKGDEIIFKENIDAELISACVRLPYFSPMLYEFLDLNGRVLEETNLKKLKINEKEITFKKLKEFQVNRNLMIIGFIDKNNISHLAPSNSTLITNKDRIIIIKTDKSKK